MKIVTMEGKKSVSKLTLPLLVVGGMNSKHHGLVVTGRCDGAIRGHGAHGEWVGFVGEFKGEAVGIELPEIRAKLVFLTLEATTYLVAALKTYSCVDFCLRFDLAEKGVFVFVPEGSSIAPHDAFKFVFKDLTKIPPLKGGIGSRDAKTKAKSTK